MSSVDSRIVTMKFDNAAFKKEAATTLSVLDKLKASLNFGSASATATKGLGLISGALSKFGIKNPFAATQKGITDLHASSERLGTVGMGTITGGVSNVSKSFLAMSTVAITTLAHITTQALTAGSQITKSLTIDPIKSGLSEYETNLNSIQTILANTEVSGATLGDVNKALEELNHYSDQTIYNFSEMARNIGTFTAAGVDLDTSVASIKGLANLAALSGSNSQQAATAMYQLSQEIASGRVSLMGWNSVVNAGMGGSTFQRALVQTAQNMGQLDGAVVKFQGKMKNATIDGKSFRDSIMAKPGEVSWLSSKVLTRTLEQFTGDMTRAELAAQGFNDEQIKAIRQTAKTAKDAATKVKTLTGVLDTAKEVVGSGWAKTWQIIFGDFKEARNLFTNVSNTVNGILGDMAQQRNDILGDWDALGGRDLAIQAIADAFTALKQILRPIRNAFRDIFPAKTGEDLFRMTEALARFTKSLQISEDTSRNLRRTFAGVFAIFSIVGQVIGAVVDQVGRLFGAVGDGSGEFLNFTGGIGDALVALDAFLEESGLLKDFFSSIGNILSIPLSLLRGVASLIGGLFSGFDQGTADAVVGAVDEFGNALSPVEAAGARVAVVFGNISDVLSRAGEIIGNALMNIGSLISNSITPDTFDSALSAINTALLGGIVIMLKRFFSGGIDVSGGLFDGIKETLGAATGALENMQSSLKADILLKIAAALAILTASLVVLALIDGKKLAKALAGMSIGFAGMSAALIALSTSISFLGMAKLPFISASMLALAAALLVLSAAVKVMSSMGFGHMMRGLFGIATMLFILNKAMGPLTANAAGMIRVSASLLVLGVALNVMAVALKLFATMGLDEMGKGLLGVAGSLVVLAGAMHIMPKGMVLQAAAILVLSTALNALGIAVKIFSTMDWNDIARGLTAVAGTLTAIAVAMRLMPKGMILQAAALNAVAVALNVLAAAVKIMASMGWEEIGKGMTVLAGSLLILAAALNLMSGTLLGAAALTVAAGALALLAPVLVVLGSLDWMTILKSLATLAGVFVVLGLAGFVLAPLVPVILGLGAALVLMGAGLSLAGAGALAFATAFGVIVATGTAGVQVMAQMLGTFIESIPAAMAAFGAGVVAFVKSISDSGPRFVQAMGKIIGNMLDAIIRNIPKMGRLFMTLLNTGLRVVVTMTPRIIDAGLKLIIGFLSAIERNIGKIVAIATSLIVKFLTAVGNKLPAVVQAGVKLIIKFINGVSQAIDDNSKEMGEAFARLGLAMMEGMAEGIKGGAGLIKDAAMDAAKSAWEDTKDFFKIGSPSKLMRDDIGRWIPIGTALGIRDEAHRPAEEIAIMGYNAIAALSRSMSGISDAIALEADMNPTISPVLDLTQLKKEARNMNSILAASPIQADLSYNSASNISAESQAAQEASLEVAATTVSTTEIKLEQNNYSPKPIDPIETYRNTKSLLSLTKEALNA